MNNASNVIIVGGGLVGVTTAWELVQRGMKVTLLEALDGLALETSLANGGMLTASMSDPWNSPGVGRHLLSSLFDPYSSMKLRLKALPSLTTWGIKFLANSTHRRHEAATRANYRLSKYSLDESDRLIERLNLKCDYATHGALKVFESESALRGPASIARNLAELGLVYEVLSKREILSVEPQLAGSIDRLACAMYFPDDRSTNSHLFTSALGQKAQEAGVNFKLNTRVKRLIVEKGQFVGVETDAGEFFGGALVLTAGNHTPMLAEQVGVKLPIRPAKGYSATISTQGWNEKPRVPVVDDAMHAAVSPLGDVVRLAGTAEFAGFDRRINTSRIDNLFQIFNTIYPDLATAVDRSKSENWTAFRPMSADGKPFIGATKVGGVFVNSGHGHLGLTMAVGSAKILADIVAGKSPSIDASPFKIDR